MGAPPGLSLRWTLRGRPALGRVGAVCVLAALLATLGGLHDAFTLPLNHKAEECGSGALRPALAGARLAQAGARVAGALARATAFLPVAPPVSVTAATENPGPQDFDDSDGEDLGDGVVLPIVRAGLPAGAFAATLVMRVRREAGTCPTQRAPSGPGAPRGPPPRWRA